MAKHKFWTTMASSLNGLGLQLNEFLTTHPDIRVKDARVICQTDGWYRAFITYKPNKSIISKFIKNRSFAIVWLAFAKCLMKNSGEHEKRE